MDPFVVALLAGIVVVSIAVIAVIVYVWDYGSSLTEQPQAALDETDFGRETELLADPPSIESVPKVNTHEDGDPIYVPVIDVTLDSDGEPDRTTAYRIAADVITAVHPRYADTKVRNYDVQFVYGEPRLGGLIGTTKRRIAVTPDLAERLDREPGFGPSELREAIESRDNGDDEIPPVAWGEPLDYWSEEASTTTAATTVVH